VIIVSMKRLPAALCAAEGKLAPDHRVTERTLAGVVRRLDAFDLQERPEPIAMAVKLAAHSLKIATAALRSGEQ
jgi:hypothetical protein